MGHDATKVLLGSTRSSSKQGTEVFASDPATYKAGLAVRRASTGLLSLTKSAGRWAGISLGRNLADSKKTTVLMAGEQVPMLLSLEPARGVVKISSYADLVDTSGDTVTVGATAFVAQSSAVSHGGGTFRAATSNDATAASLADQINNHAVAKLVVHAIAVGPLVTITALGNTTDGNAIILSYTDAHATTVGAIVYKADGVTAGAGFLTGGGGAADYVSIGQHVYISDETGMADDPESSSTISNAVYASIPLTGIDEDGNAVAAVIVDITGGL